MPVPITSSNLLLILFLAVPSADAQSGAEFRSNAYGNPAGFKASMAMAIVVFLLCAFFLMGLFSICIRRCDEEESTAAVGTGAPATCQRGLDPAVIETFPILVYSAIKDLKIGKGALECAVCLRDFSDYETLRLIPKCDHVFHPDCIDAWLAAHVTCPVCRAKLSPEPNSQTAELNDDSNLESSIEVGEVPNDAAALHADQDHSGGPQAETVGHTVKSGIFSGKFPRSHSTGHSLIRPVENTERYTLRLPEEVRRRLVSSGNNKLRRSTSYDVVLRRVGSSRKGYRFGGSVDNQTGCFDPWVLLRTPSFLARGGSVTGKSHKTPLLHVKTPLDSVNVKAERDNESISRLPV